MPDQSLPPFLMTSDPGSFARHTILERKPQIIRQVLADNAYPPQSSPPWRPSAMRSPPGRFSPCASLPRMCQTGTVNWRAMPAKPGSKSPGTSPRPISIAGCWRQSATSSPGQDRDAIHSSKQKASQMDGDVQRLSSIWEQFATPGNRARFEALLHSSLWGNRADLSNFTVKVKARSGLATVAERPLILIDHTEQVRRPAGRRPQRGSTLSAITWAATCSSTWPWRTSCWTWAGCRKSTCT